MATEQFNRPDSPASSSISASLPSSMPSSIHASLEVDSSVCSTEANQPIHQSDLIEASKEAKEVFIGSVQCQNNVTDNNSKSSLSNGLSTTSQDDKNVNDTMSDTSSIDTLQLHPRLAVCDSFTLNDFYRLAVKFYKVNENKAFHPTYDQRNLFYALHLQIKHGPFIEEKAPQLGVLDFIGKDRRLIWKELGDLEKEQSQIKFVNSLRDICEAFELYIEAHQRERQERTSLERQQQEQERVRIEQDQQRQFEEQQRIKIQEEEEEQRREQQKLAFKEALNRQTYPQFKEYAVQQYPQSVEQQEQLIHQLQGQHFLQYVQQMMQSQTDPQNFYAQQEQRVQLKTRTETNQNNNAFGSPSEQETLISTRQQFSDLNMNGDCNDSGSIKTSPSYNSPSSSSHELQCETKIQESNSIQNGSFSGSTKNLAHVKDTSIYPLHMSNNEEENEQQTEDEGANDEEEDDDNKEVEISIAAPQIWTKKIIKSFKESIAKDSGDGIIKIGHGEVLTVRVPTHCNGNCIVWEFATDSYDIGFGLLFEWNQNPGEDVTVHISESEDDDDEEEDDEEDDDEEVKASTSDPERGTLRTRSHSSTMETVVRHVGPSTSHDLPISVIIPIYRRDCHEEVYAGSHVYPGKGAYLLKFDNTYSLWRAKTLYYRVYYTN